MPYGLSVSYTGNSSVLTAFVAESTSDSENISKNSTDKVIHYT